MNEELKTPEDVIEFQKSISTPKAKKSLII
jgi:hypothetical protein